MSAEVALPNNPNIPLSVVDLSSSKILDETSGQALADDLVRVMRDVGFCYISGHDIADDAISGMFQTARDFFALPEAEKGGKMGANYIGVRRSAMPRLLESGEVVYAPCPSSIQRLADKVRLACGEGCLAPPSD